MPTLPAAYRAVQPEFKSGETTQNGTRKDVSPSRTQHFETLHYNPQWKLDMGTEEKLGLVPQQWSTSNAMSDGRPNGRSIFDARHTQTPVGRMRGSDYKSSYDPRGVRSRARTQPDEPMTACATTRASLCAHRCARPITSACAPVPAPPPCSSQLVFGGDAQFAAAEMADETNAAQASAELYKIESNQGAREGRAAWS